MAIQLISARDAALKNGIKVLIYGPAGSGKTVFCTTAPEGEKALIISAEGGLLSIQDDQAVDICVVSSIDDVYEIFNHLKGDHPYQWVCLDSISEIAEVVLTSEKAKTKDPRQAYGALIDQMTGLIRSFRDLPTNVVMTAKMDRVNDEHANTLLFMPSMPGARLAQSLGYFFDEVFCMRLTKNADGVLERSLQTSRDIQYEAKDRSGKLDQYEYPTLANIANKIRN